MNDEHDDDDEHDNDDVGTNANDSSVHTTVNDHILGDMMSDTKETVQAALLTVTNNMEIVSDTISLTTAIEHVVGYWQDHDDVLISSFRLLNTIVAKNAN